MRTGRSASAVRAASVCSAVIRLRRLATDRAFATSRGQRQGAKAPRSTTASRTVCAPGASSSGMIQANAIEASTTIGPLFAAFVTELLPGLPTERSGLHLLRKHPQLFRRRSSLSSPIGGFGRRELRDRLTAPRYEYLLTLLDAIEQL